MCVSDKACDSEGLGRGAAKGLQPRAAARHKPQGHDQTSAEFQFFPQTNLNNQPAINI